MYDTAKETLDSIARALQEFDCYRVEELDSWNGKLDAIDNTLRDLLAEIYKDGPLPEYKIGPALNGHVFAYPVVGRYEDGTLKTTTRGMIHQDDCPCTRDPEWVDDGIL